MDGSALMTVLPVGGLGVLAVALFVAWRRTVRAAEAAATLHAEAVELTQAITATAQDAIVMVDGGGRIVFWNKAAENMFGYPAEAVEGRNLLPLVVPERYHEAVVEGLAHFRKTGKGGAIGKMLRVEARRRDGTEFPIEHSLSAVRFKGAWHAVAVLRDVSERYRAEDALADSERRFRAIADYAYDWDYWLDPKGRPEWVNSAVERVIGYSVTECMALPDYPLAMVHHADKPLMAHHLQRARKEEFENDIEFRVVCKNSAVKWMAASYQPIYDRDETFIGSRWTVRDITARKKAEWELRSSEATKRAIVDSSLDCIITMDHKGHVVEFNPAAEATFGYRREDVIGRRLGDLIIPDGLRQDHENGLSRYLRTGRGAVFNRRLELTAMRSDGSEFPVELTVTVIQTGERPLFTGFLRDLTAAKAAEEALKRNHTLLETINRVRSLFIGETDPDEVFETLLTDVLKLSGSRYGFIAELRTDEEGREYQQALAITDIAWDEQTRAFYEANAPSGFRFYTFDGLHAAAVTEKRVIIADDPATHPNSSGRLPEGHPPLERFLGLPLWRGGEIIGSIGLANREGEYDEELVAYLEPVTNACAQVVDGYRNRRQREEAERELAEKTEALERSNDELQQFAYVVSHDLQEPLRMVTSYLGLLKRRFDDKLGGEADEFIGFAVDGAQRMRLMIQDLLAYSRVGTRGQPFRETDMEAVLDEALANLQVRIEETGAEITRDPMPVVSADARQMVRLFQNLIGNALKYSRPDVPPKVHVGVAQDRLGWTFSVKDNGIGIASEHFERIFGVFQRLHGRGRYEGTGIGLAICRRIVERHGGQITVDSVPDEGATFSFFISRGLTHSEG